jgi:2-dehydropantoate 2-reductase
MLPAHHGILEPLWTLRGRAMRILVYGAGVIGTLYGARLQQAGNEVVVVARGRRLQDVRASGLVIEDVGSGARETIPVGSIAELLPDDAYDLVVVPVRRDELGTVLEPLGKSRATPVILFFGNNAQGAGVLTDRLGSERVVLGFPGAGGQLVHECVHYLMIPEQRTTLGEIDGRSSERIKRLAAVFKAAGFPVVISSDMQAWLKTHAAFVTSVAAAVYAARGDAHAVASDDALLSLMVHAIREAFRTLRQNGAREVPWNLRLLHELMPEWFAVRYWRRAFRGPLGQFSFAAHSNAARDEMEQLAADVWRLTRIGPGSLPTPSLDRLFRQAGLLPHGAG